ncbi:hypothetical protein PACILC2_17600 [Paenibacillus cisolokensis]|uniref:Uncharacterized protein n=1 Tax=Paenibacillus cisolokensis TaxID=1658519 RepID=A0ABQ4N4U4_9BACL|nr:hypothetical protein PACILC2_17600 [Paenibacillus cisolokensis]
MLNKTLSFYKKIVYQFQNAFISTPFILNYDGAKVNALIKLWGNENGAEIQNVKCVAARVRPGPRRLRHIRRRQRRQ